MPYADPDQRRTYHREYMRMHPQTLTRAQMDARNTRIRKAYSPVTHREKHLWHRYSMTQSDYDCMLIAQGGHCKFCKAVNEKNGRPLAVDHDRTTGKVRGILCHRHNAALGTFGDTEEGILKALAYVRGDL